MPTGLLSSKYRCTSSNVDFPVSVFVPCLIKALPLLFMPSLLRLVYKYTSILPSIDEPRPLRLIRYESIFNGGQGHIYLSLVSIHGEKVRQTCTLCSHSQVHDVTYQHLMHSLFGEIV